MSVPNSASRWGEVKSYVTESKNQQNRKSEVFTHTKRWTESSGFHQVSSDPNESKQLSQKWHTVIDSTLGFNKQPQKPKMMTQRWNPDSGFKQNASTSAVTSPTTPYATFSPSSESIKRDRSQSLSIIETPLRREFIESIGNEQKKTEEQEQTQDEEQPRSVTKESTSIEEKMSETTLSDTETVSEKSSTVPSPIIEPKVAPSLPPPTSNTSISSADPSPRLTRKEPSRANLEFNNVQLRASASERQLDSKTSTTSAADKRNFRQSVSLHDLGATQSNTDLCFFCGKRVYLMEKKNLGEKVFHMPCFKCCVCNKAQSLTGGYFFQQDKLYCRLHYERLSLYK